MIKTATRRFAAKKAAQMSPFFGLDRIYSYDKSGLDRARRRMDLAIVDEAVRSMLEPEPEPEYFAVIKEYESDWGYPEWYTFDVFDSYHEAQTVASSVGGHVTLTDAWEYDYHRARE